MVVALAMVALAGPTLPPPPGWTVASAPPWRFDADGVVLVPPPRDPLDEVRIVLPLESPYPGAVRRFVVALDDRLSGPRASPVFRNDLAAFDVYWQLVARGIAAVPPVEEADATDLLLVASGFAADDVISEMLARSDGLASASRALRTVFVPSLSISPGSRRPIALGPADPTTRNNALARAALDEPGAKPVRSRSRLDLGTTLDVRDLDDPDDEPLLDVASYVTGQSIGLRTWRAAVLASGAWELSARQPVVGVADVAATMRSQEGDLGVGRVTFSATRPLTWRGDDTWQLRVYSTRIWATEQREDERIVGVELRARTRWHAPFGPDRAMPGSRWDRPDPSTPWQYVEPTVVVIDGSAARYADDHAVADADR